MIAKCSLHERQEDLRPLALPPFPHALFPLLRAPFLLLCYFGTVSFVTMTLDNFLFQNQVRLPQTSVKVPGRLKFKRYEVFVERGSMKKFLFVERQDIVNYWDFPPTFSKTATKRWYQKLLDIFNENCWKNAPSRPACLFCRCCLHDSVCSAFRAATTQEFSQSLSSHTITSCLALRTPAIWYAAKSNKSPLTHFEPGQENYMKKELRFSQ